MIDACYPDADIQLLKKLVKLNTGENLTLTREQICQAYDDIQDGKLPLPPMIMSSNRTYLVDKKSPLKVQDYDILFSSTSKRKDLRRIAYKVGLKRLDQMTKIQVIDAIGKRLRYMKIHEPVKIGRKQKVEKGFSNTAVNNAAVNNTVVNNTAVNNAAVNNTAVNNAAVNNAAVNNAAVNNNSTMNKTNNINSAMKKTNNINSAMKKTNNINSAMRKTNNTNSRNIRKPNFPKSIKMSQPSFLRRNNQPRKTIFPTSIYGNRSLRPRPRPQPERPKF